MTESLAGVMTAECWCWCIWWRRRQRRFRSLRARNDNMQQQHLGCVCLVFRVWDYDYIQSSSLLVFKSLSMRKGLFIIMTWLFPCNIVPLLILILLLLHAARVRLHSYVSLCPKWEEVGKVYISGVEFSASSLIPCDMHIIICQGCLCVIICGSRVNVLWLWGVKDGGRRKRGGWRISWSEWIDDREDTRWFPGICSSKVCCSRTLFDAAKAVKKFQKFLRDSRMKWVLQKKFYCTYLYNTFYILCFMEKYMERF